MVFFSFDAETSLSRINLEDTKSAFFTGYLEQTILANLAAYPVMLFSFELKLLALTCFTDGYNIRFSLWVKEAHLLQIKSHLHPADSCVVLPLVEPLHFELL